MSVWLALFLGLLMLIVLTALPWLLLGEWERAREASDPAVALLAGWLLHDLHEKRRRP